MVPRLSAGQARRIRRRELWTADLDAARRHLTESIDIARALDARHSAVIATFNLGLTEYLDSAPAAAAALFAESLDLARRMGMKRHTGPGWC